MYKPPENSNRVKSMKSKFENMRINAKCSSGPDKIAGNAKNHIYESKPARIQKTEEIKTHSSINEKSSYFENKVTSKNALSHQLSDPLKTNIIKRTPAFRLEKNMAKIPVSKNVVENKYVFELKSKQINDTLKKYNIDYNVASRNGSPSNFQIKNESKPMLIKSKSSHDFAYLRNKFNSPTTPSQNVKAEETINKTNKNGLSKEIDLSMLYTEPIPKSLRNKPPVLVMEQCDSPSLQLLQNKEVPVKSLSSDSSNQPSNQPSNHNPSHNQSSNEINFGNQTTVYNCSTLKVDESLDNCRIPNLSYFLSLALKKPLPTGPAPKKPPRTFRYCADKQLNGCDKNVHYLMDENIDCKAFGQAKSSAQKRTDPKYMLNKLETALKNNKLRARKQSSTNCFPICTEETDDSFLFQDDLNASDGSEILSAVNHLYKDQEMSNFSFRAARNDKGIPIYDEPIPKVPASPKAKYDKNESNCSNNLYSVIQDNSQDSVKEETHPNLRSGG